MLDLVFAGAAGDFLLHSTEGDRVYDGWVVILNVVFWAFAVIDLDLSAYAVGYVGLVQNCVTLVFLVSEYRPNGRTKP